MKISVDLEQLEQALAEAPYEAVQISTASRKTDRKTNGNLKERLREAALHALDDMEDQLTYEEISQPDGSVKKVSKISEATRAKMNMYLVKSDPDNQANRQQPTIIKIETNFATLESASQSARFAQTKVIAGNEAAQKLLEGSK